MQNNCSQDSSPHKMKVLFLIHDLGVGGAEKVLVNLVNNMDRSKFDVSVTALFGGVNEQFLKPDIHYRTIFSRSFRGNSRIMKLLSPKQLHRLLVKETYNIEVAYLEGPATRIISGAPDGTKVVAWLHCTMNSAEDMAIGFRNYAEAKKAYQRFDMLAFVSQGVQEAFEQVYEVDCPQMILYNTNESEMIIQSSKEPINNGIQNNNMFCWCGVGKIVKNKGFDRMLRVQKRLISEGYKTHFFALGMGDQETELKQWCKEQKIANNVTFMGYQTNPYKYVAKCDLFVCASYAEGFSTAATEALIVGTPVCTVEVSGMKEMLGENNEYGLVVENNEEALYQGIKKLLDDPELLKHYKKKAAERGKMFSTEKTVNAVQDMLTNL